MQRCRLCTAPMNGCLFSCKSDATSMSHIRAEQCEQFRIGIRSVLWVELGNICYLWSSATSEHLRPIVCLTSMTRLYCFFKNADANFKLLNQFFESLYEINLATIGAFCVSDDKGPLWLLCLPTPQIFLSPSKLYFPRVRPIVTKKEYSIAY